MSLPIAFLAGMLSFLSPCVLPLVPTYLLYLGGNKGRPIVNALAFIGGFSLVFLILFGLPATLLGSLLVSNKTLLSQIGGVVVIGFGLMMLGLKPALLSRGLNLRFGGDAARPWGALTLGAVLAIGWTPCIGPLLGATLTLITNEGRGFELLLAYVMGLAIPFLLVAAFTDRAVSLVRRTARYTKYIERGAGVFLIAVGLLMATGTLTMLNGFFNQITPEWLRERL
ncbi:cytochrome c biogenesis CcdA family protein [Calidithermus timidus]|jgi:cytochrome c-type biogenesis protein|uniref:cytochrome c biogenesis CcdA family protein n=1 Tax=Calidithermus timidus TaxID=307124 RepID=UPI000360D71C|nr:cytochrome c biogenesis CcdA family protein [Calidithermus timidus]